MIVPEPQAPRLQAAAFGRRAGLGLRAIFSEPAASAPGHSQDASARSSGPPIRDHHLRRHGLIQTLTPRQDRRLRASSEPAPEAAATKVSVVGAARDLSRLVNGRAAAQGRRVRCHQVRCCDPHSLRDCLRHAHRLQCAPSQGRVGAPSAVQARSFRGWAVGFFLGSREWPRPSRGQARGRPAAGGHAAIDGSPESARRAGRSCLAHGRSGKAREQVPLVERTSPRL